MKGHSKTVAELLQAIDEYDWRVEEAEKLKDELSKLQAEREPRDNGDGTVTAWLPVTYPDCLDVEAVRAPKKGEWIFCDATGAATTCVNDFKSREIRLILRPAPKPPEPVTWEAPLVDGEWTATSGGFTGADNRRWLWDSTGSIITGLSKPAVLGKYQFKGGVGTLIQESK